MEKEKGVAEKRRGKEKKGEERIGKLPDSRKAERLQKRDGGEDSNIGHMTASYSLIVSLPITWTFINMGIFGCTGEWQSSVDVSV